MSVVTAASIFGYTPNYAPLEQVQGLGTDARSDLYSLAATTYHLATGVKPPDALSRAASLVNGQPDPLLPANEVTFQVNSAVATVLAKAMAQNRDQRYASAGEMRVALSAAAESGSTVADREAATVLLPGSGATTVRTPASEQPTALAGERRTAIPTERQTVAAETVTRVQSVAPRKSSAVWKAAIAAAVLLACAGGFYGYRLIRDRAAAADRSTASQPVDPNSNAQPVAEPSATAVNEINVEGNQNTAAESPAQRASSGKEPAKQNSALATRKTNELSRKEPPDTPAAPDTSTSNPFPNANSFPQLPSHPIVPNTGVERTERTRGGAVVRTLRDGTQIVTQPDGTTIVRRPNGATRVFGPGQTPIPRQRPRRRLP